MARRARTYTRDNRGRFASSPGGGPKAKPKPRTSFRQRQAVSLARSRGQTGRLGSATKAAKARLKATKARTGASASPQQKAALTRAKRMASMLAGERRVKTVQKAGVIKGRIRRDPGAAAKLKPQQPPRRLQRSALDQAHRDKVAKQLRSLEKPARRALQVSKKMRGMQLVPPLTGKRRPSYMDATGHSRFLRERIQEQANRLMDSPTRGKNKLTDQERKKIVSDMTATARKLKARAAMVIAKPSGKRTVKTAPKPGVIKGRVRRDSGVGVKLGAVKRKTIQGEQARKDRAEMAAHRKKRAKQLLAMPKAARRAIQTENTARRSGLMMMGDVSRAVQDIAEGRMRLAHNFGKRKDRLSPRAINMITQTMQHSADKLRKLMAKETARRTRPKSKVVPRSERRRVAGPRKAGVVAKPRGLKPGALAASKSKAAPARIRQRSRAEQDQRNQIAAALMRMPKEKRAKFIKARKEMQAEARSSQGTSAGAPLTQKERWARRADVYRRAATKNRERAAALEAAAAPYARDYAFNTQPGRFSARKRVSGQLDRAFKLRQKAKQQEQRVKELTRLATTNKGDAERKRQAQRDAVAVEKGSRISTLMYGPGKVVRVNKKTISYFSDQTGSVINVDKSWVKAF